jgi:hypothetical protein
MLPLSRSDPLLSEFPPFMLDVREVVDSPAESPNVFAREMNKSQKLLLETGQIGLSDLANWMVQFRQHQRQSGAPSTSGEGVLLPAKWHLTRGRDKMHDNSRTCGSG